MIDSDFSGDIYSFTFFLQIVLSDKNDSSIDRPYGLTFYNNTLYWSEFRKGSIHSLHLQDRKIESIIEEGTSLFEVKVYADDLQPGRKEVFSNFIL